MEMDVRGPGCVESFGSLRELPYLLGGRPGGKESVTSTPDLSTVSAQTTASEAIISVLKGLLNLSRQTELPSPVVKEQITQLGAKSTNPQMPGCPEAVNSAFSVLQPARAQFQTRTADAQKNAIDPSQAIVRDGKMGKIAILCTTACRICTSNRKSGVCLFCLLWDPALDRIGSCVDPTWWESKTRVSGKLERRCWTVSE
jgi:hypothetical protein